MAGHIPVEPLYAPKPKRPFRWLVRLLVFLVVMLTIVILGISVYVGLNMTRTDTKPLMGTPEDVDLPYEDMSYFSADGETSLSGWLIEPESDATATIIMSHGYRGNREEENVGFLSLANEFREEGYRVILYDFRNAGDSAGSITTIGDMEQDDLAGTVEWANERFDDPVILYGISMGAATTLGYAGREDSEDIASIVVDSPFSSLRSYLETNMSVWTNLPDFPFTPIILYTAPLYTGIDVDRLEPIEAVNSIYPTPILFIHSIDDPLIPYTESERMHALHPDAFDIWLPEGPDHVQTYPDMPEEYLERVLPFIEDALAN
ncbi:alpha/beta fold hydrolase [Paenalkalicoccus suaedae]|uniref:Alpha/beta fold hydrolase n=1 Tax=Paenalkalicoccus suaedae TaxID=2592382 RepID=A0A859FCA5_9BACI|nr:alpha/beta fold hydrolase [Paenalkalicoccus suaedae]QKS70697.1 alpha/beta fold hydrolase [Paenalkalicoccus suaedae]